MNTKYMNKILNITSINVNKYFYTNKHVIIGFKNTFNHLNFDSINFGIFSIADKAFYNCNEFKKTSNIKTIIWKSNEQNQQIFIGYNAFWNCDGIQKIVIEINGHFITKLYSFNICTSLLHIFIGNKTQLTIGDGAFAGCKSLRGFDLKSKGIISNIYAQAFMDCSCLQTKNIACMKKNISNKLSYVENVKKNTVLGCAIYQVDNEDYYLAYNSPILISGDISDKIKINKMQSGAFANCCSLSSINLSNVSVDYKMLPKKTFYKCISLKQVRLPDISIIDSIAFYSCVSLKKIIWHKKSIKNLLSISDFAFQYCTGIEKLDFSKFESLNSIGVCSFFGCVKIKEIFFSKSLQNISAGAFYMCHDIKRIHFYSLPKEINWDAFSFCNSSGTIFIGNRNSIDKHLLISCGLSLWNIKIKK